LISRDTIEEVKNRVDIVDVISDFISLKKSGANYKALSPFGNEKTPSFFVVPAKGIFKDFSSGKGGDAFTFVMEHEKLSYLEAIRYLAKKYGVEIKEDKQTDEQQAAQSEREGLYILMNFAKEFYKSKLLDSDEGQSIGLSYFRERGFTDHTVQKFELGYALEGWDNLRKEALAKGYNEELLEKTGLVVKKEDGSSYDRFRGRVIFPVQNLSGKTIAFGARMLGKDKNQPKYINSPETDIYHKSDVLYGLYQGKNAIRQHDNCFLVEGYTDVISMHQADVENVVASSGTALTEEQIKLIRRFTENITVVFDGDAAGIKAAIRGIDLILKGGLNVRVVLFPDGEDPDSYSRKVGTSAFQNYLKEARKDFISFVVESLPEEIKLDPLRKSEALISVLNSLSLIPDEKKRAPHYHFVSNKFQVSVETVINEANKIRLKREYASPQSKDFQKEALRDSIQAQQEPVILVDSTSRIYFQERETIRLLLNYADQKIIDQNLAEFLMHELDDVEFSNDTFREIHEIYKDGLAKGELPAPDYFLRNGSEAVKKTVTDLVTSRYDTSQHWEDKYKIFIPKENQLLNQMALTNVLRLKFRIVQKMMEDNLDEVKKAEASGDWDILDQALTTQSGLKQAEQELAKELGIVVAR
jgi:DNA primase